jgi:GAF domain-containing protein/cbb3-type cytochrome oxidase subunit 3
MAEYDKNSLQPGWLRTAGWLIKTKVDHAAQARQGRLAAVILLIGLILALGALIAGGLIRFANLEPTAASTLLARLGVLIVPFGVLYFLNRRGLTTLAGVLLALVLLGLSFWLLRSTGPQTPNAIVLVVPVIIVSLLVPPLWTIAVTSLAGVGYFVVNLMASPTYMTDLFQGGPATQTGLVYINLALVAVLLWLLSRTAQQAIQESQQLSLTLVEQREELEHRLVIQTRQLQATTTVAHAVAGARDPDQLLEDIVRLVRETFGYYHVQVFLVDEGEGYAILRQSTGEVGQALLSQGHRLAVGSLSVIGQVTSRGQPVIARDTDKDVVHRRNELLPLTRSEMAIPLMIGDRVIGALDMQSLEPDAFGEDMMPTFQALADQLAVAIENARLYEQTQENLRELRELSQDMTQRTWAEFLAETRQQERLQIYGQDTKLLQSHRSRIVERVLNAGNLITSTGRDGALTFIAAPIVVRNEVVGVLGVEPGATREWTQEDVQLLQNIADRTAMAVEKARLYFQAQRAAERERLINAIASRLQRAPTLALLLESAARELAQALGTDNVYAEISVETPLTHTRKSVSDTSSQTDEEGVDETSSERGVSAADEHKEARAEP